MITLRRIFSALSLNFIMLMPAFSQPPSIVVTIKPLHSLVSGLTDSVTTPHLLLSGAVSPHTYQLRPSDALSLQKADLIVWVGPELENFLMKPLQTLAAPIPKVAFLQVPGITLYPVKQEHVHSHGAHSAHSFIDPHAWLDVDNAALFVEKVAQHLIDLDPENKYMYIKNKEVMLQRLHSLGDRLEHQFEAIPRFPFLVFHDAFQYLEKKYHLNNQGILSLNPHTNISAKHLQKLRTLIQEKKISCLFTEPEFRSLLVVQLEQDLNLYVAEIDPLAIHQPQGQEAYFKMLEDMVQAFQYCAFKKSSIAPKNNPAPSH